MSDEWDLNDGHWKTNPDGSVSPVSAEAKDQMQKLHEYMRGKQIYEPVKDFRCRKCGAAGRIGQSVMRCFCGAPLLKVVTDGKQDQ